MPMTNLAELPRSRLAILKSNSQRGSMQTVPFDAEYLRRLAGSDPNVEQHFCAYFGELLHLKLRVGAGGKAAGSRSRYLAIAVDRMTRP